MPAKPDTGPPNKWTNYLDLSEVTGGSATLTALSGAWADYYAEYGAYPDVWVMIGSILYYGGY